MNGTFGDEADKELGDMAGELNKAHAMVADLERRLELTKDVVIAAQRLHDRFYPNTVFDGSSGDEGPLYILNLRNALKRLEDNVKGIA